MNDINCFNCGRKLLFDGIKYGDIYTCECGNHECAECIRIGCNNEDICSLCYVSQ